MSNWYQKTLSGIVCVRFIVIITCNSKIQYNDMQRGTLGINVKGYNIFFCPTPLTDQIFGGIGKDEEQYQ